MLIFLKSFFLLSALFGGLFFLCLSCFGPNLKRAQQKMYEYLPEILFVFLQRNFAAASTADDAKYQVRVYVFRFVVLWSRRVIERWFPLLAFLFLLALPLSLSFW